MKIDERITKYFEDLIAEGQRVVSSARTPANVSWASIVDRGQTVQWATKTLSLIDRIYGSGSTHASSFRDALKDHSDGKDVSHALGVLRGAHQEYAAGALFDIRKLIEAEIFDDFIEQAEHLHASGYYQVAAVVVGCVLEDGLRKLCQGNEIELSEKPKLDTMNALLAKAEVISKLEQKKVTALADLRNKAAHGQWDQFEESDVKEMIGSVKLFMERHFM